MKIKLRTRQDYCEVIREPGDPVFSGVRNAAGESRLLYHLKEELKRRGYDVIKKRMAKDGHLVSDMQQYVRTRKSYGPGPVFCIWNSRWAIEGAEKEFNREGRVRLAMEGTLSAPRFVL